MAADAGIECINCAVCYAACDVVRWKPDYLGPAALNRAWTLVNDVRDGAGQRPRRGGLGRPAVATVATATAASCSRALPGGAHPHPTLAIAGLKRASGRSTHSWLRGFGELPSPLRGGAMSEARQNGSLPSAAGSRRLSALVLAPLVLVHIGLIVYCRARRAHAAEEILGRTQGSLFWGAVLRPLRASRRRCTVPIGLRTVVARMDALARPWLDCGHGGLRRLVLVGLGLRAVVAVVGFP